MTGRIERGSWGESVGCGESLSRCGYSELQMIPTATLHHTSHLTMGTLTSSGSKKSDFVHSRSRPCSSGRPCQLPPIDAGHLHRATQSKMYLITPETGDERWEIWWMHFRPWGRREDACGRLVVTLKTMGMRMLVGDLVVILRTMGMRMLVLPVEAGHKQECKKK